MSDGPPTLRMTAAEQDQAVNIVPLDERTLIAVVDRLGEVLDKYEFGDPQVYGDGLTFAVALVDEMLAEARQAHCP